MFIFFATRTSPVFHVNVHLVGKTGHLPVQEQAVDLFWHIRPRIVTHVLVRARTVQASSLKEADPRN
jgi:hypothetical protein